MCDAWTMVLPAFFERGSIMLTAHINQNTKEEQSVQAHLEGASRHAEVIGGPLHIKYLAKLTAYLHDLGKSRQMFNRYIHQAVENPDSVRRGSVNHSSAGAIYVYQRYYHGELPEKITAQLIADAILSHHGLNDCLSPDGIDVFHKRVESLEDLDYDEVLENFNRYGIGEQILDRWFEKAVDEVKEFFAYTKDRELSGPYCWTMLHRILFSILVDADRLDTAIFNGERISCLKAPFSPDWDTLCIRLERYLEVFKSEDRISRIRKKVSDECLGFADHFPGIYQLSVPTGGAKTLSGLRFALNHARLHHKSRVFYIAPYLSILEQNAEVFRKALGAEAPILEHHSNVIPEDGEEEKRTELDLYKHLTENWDSPIVVTTFVQFLNTLFSDSLQSVRRFHSLLNAVILIDEIQSLPIQMIYLFNMTMNFLHKVYGTTVVLCSATQPILDKVKYPIHLTRPVSIVREPEVLYRELKRVDVREISGEMDPQQIREFVVKQLEDKESVLLVLNTKTMTSRVFQELLSYNEQGGRIGTLIHLSTNMCPQHRLDRLEEIRQKLGKGKLVCVSTSLIEAGVDLSFSCVIRDFTSLDSIAQAAGRCNRNLEVQMGTVYLVHVRDEKLGSMEQIVKAQNCCQPIVDEYKKNPQRYQGDLLSPRALEDFYQKYFYDPDQQNLMSYPLKSGGTMMDLLQCNYQGLRAYKDRTGEELPKDLTFTQAFHSAGREFEVIEQYTTSVLVPYREGKEIIAALNGEISPEEFPGYLRRAQRYTVNISERQKTELAKQGALYYLKNGRIPALEEGFYERDLGVTLESKLELLNI